MVELSTRKRGIRGDGGNHHEKLGLKRISCASQFTIPDMAGTSSDPAGNNTDTRFCKPNKASRTRDFSGPHISSISFSSSSLVLATVPDHHLGSGSGSEPNRCKIGGPGFQYTRTVNSGLVRCKSPNPSELGGLSAGRPAGPSVDLYNVLVFAVG